MAILLTSDWHLTDKPDDDYRWLVCDKVSSFIAERGKCHVIIAGDITDRKDRHSAVLVNRLTGIFESFVRNGATVTVLCGNHDAALYGPAFWNVLNCIKDVRFVTTPLYLSGGLLLLPHSAQPDIEWEGLDFKKAKCIIMHQTVTGVIGNNGHELINDRMPALPKKAIIYSGDIHNPQTVQMPNGAQVLYIGAPHHVCFGDSYACGMLALNDDFTTESIITCNTPSKLMLTVRSLNELSSISVSPDDMAKVRFNLDVSQLDSWQATLDSIKQWAASNGVKLYGVEPVLSGAKQVAPTGAPDALLSLPANVLQAFIGEESIHTELAAIGYSILRGVMNARASSNKANG